MWRAIKDLELSGNSIYKYNTDCKRFFNETDFSETPINQINENTIRLFILKTIKEQGLCKETCRKFFSYIKNVIRYARIEKIIIDNPIEFLEPKDFTKHCEEIEKPVETRYYSDSELAIIIKGLYKYYEYIPLYMPPYAIELAIYTGMRVSELSTLRWSDISDISISINKSAKHNRLKNEFSIGKTKTKKSRVYPVDEQITALLTRIRDVQENHSILCDWVFTDGNGDYVRARNITDCMTRLCKEYNLNSGGITKLRKTASSDLQNSGTSKTIVASMLGHTTEVNEMYYTYDTSNLSEKQMVIQNRNAKFKQMIK
ncbi:integrase [Aequitasia blattaphilus]|uniref:Site-specific integrase n=1 Tax=Aequitasia blattaphilus TaxID=2949332 RepID=A0ABT1E846_9FIRM|nr:site-specific integrase [Aequitasia blattaphilus]MCP1102004.1 site-specific integrase [Aequitasia blattaphilus]MCR8614644.1 site-specific integrase [Aequitasia blattaphilus]